MCRDNILISLDTYRKLISRCLNDFLNQAIWSILSKNADAKILNLHQPMFKMYQTHPKKHVWKHGLAGIFLRSYFGYVEILQFS